jgi:glycosyltransferase involved in cell wall biosynthesis
MNAGEQKPRLIVLSPFLDKSHGSERVLVEWLSHLPDAFDVHIYSQSIKDLDPTKFCWHRIPKLPGPHLFNFLWWLVASHLMVRWARRPLPLGRDLVFGSGADFPEADVICVHIVFREYVDRMKLEMKPLRTSVREWPRLFHRKLYYNVVCVLEKRAYLNPSTTLVVNSKKTAREIERFYGRHPEAIALIHLGVDHSVFNPGRRMALRQKARSELRIAEDRVAILLVGNDWKNKGVAVLIEALEQLREVPADLFIVSREDRSPWWNLVTDKGLQGRVSVLTPRNDVEFYYAAADIYAGPSVQDAYAMPPAEAMACGLPVIVSAAAGVSEIITHGVDGLILADPKDAATLAFMVRRLYQDRVFRERLGERASATMQQYSWEGNGRELAAIFEGILQRKSNPGAPSREH